VLGLCACARRALAQHRHFFVSSKYGRCFAVSEVRIKAETRSEFGKGGARRTRRAGNVPAVLYGHGSAPKHIALPAREFAAAIRHGGMTQLFSIEINDGSQALALAKAIQRDPVRDSYDHIDFLIVRRGEKITVDIPVILTGEAARDTLINQEQTTLSVVADATSLPESLEASVEGLEPGSHVTAGEVKLPEGVELAVDSELIIAIVNTAPTAADLAEAVEGEEAEAEEAAVEAGEQPAAAASDES
jgi:large subunit ribosomal protein L25